MSADWDELAEAALTHDVERERAAWAELTTCGTYAGYQRHYRRGEEIDPACRAAQRDYRRGRGMRATRFDLTERQVANFWAKVDRSGECWLWTGAVNHKRGGYGTYSANHIAYRAHRLAYVLTVGSIPGGLVLDHLCRTPACVNPAHLEPVTSRENTIRGVGPALARERRKTRCKRGHELTDGNIVILKHAGGAVRGRCCKTCMRASQYRSMARSRATKRTERLANPAPPRTHCKHGHEFTPENTYRRPNDGHRECLTCRRRRSARKGCLA